MKAMSLGRAHFEFFPPQPFVKLHMLSRLVCFYRICFEVIVQFKVRSYGPDSVCLGAKAEADLAQIMLFLKLLSP